MPTVKAIVVIMSPACREIRFGSRMTLYNLTRYSYQIGTNTRS